MLDPDPPISPMATLYEVIGEVKLVPASQLGVGPNQPVGTPKPHESGRVPDREKIHVSERKCSSQVCRKSTKRSARSGRGQSLIPDRAIMLERSKTPKRARIPERTRTPKWTKTPDRSKTLMAQASHDMPRIA